MKFARSIAPRSAWWLPVLLAVAACAGATANRAGPAAASAPSAAQGAAPWGASPWSAPSSATASPAASGAPPIASAGPPVAGGTAASGATSGAVAPPTVVPSPSVPGEAIEMRPPVPSAFADDLRALGLDVAHLPRIEKLEPRALRGVMKLFTKSLGVRCGDCHLDADFAAATPRKKIAAHMWNDFVAALSMQGGGPLFCDSCHQGRVKQLDRRDKKALSAWMDQNFVGLLARRDGKEHDCETCHVDMEMNLLAQWSR